MALAYVDWQQQEFGIAAALSEDRAMQAAYLTGDPYVAMAIAAGVLSQGATATSHPQERTQFKACALGVLNGMGAATLARQLNCSEQRAAGLLAMHRKTFPRFWSWSDGIESHALLHRELVSTVRLAHRRWRRGQSAITAQLSHAGERRRDAEARLLPCHREAALRFARPIMTLC